MLEDDNAEWVALCPAATIPEGEVIGVEIRRELVALYKVGGEIFATDNVCTHAFALLSEGWLDGDVIECPLHAGRFDIRIGKALCPPVEKDIKTYRVRIVEGQVEIYLQR